MYESQIPCPVEWRYTVFLDIILSMLTYICPKSKTVYFSVYRQPHLGFNYPRTQKVKELVIRAACEARKFARSATVSSDVSGGVKIAAILYVQQ